MHLLRRLAGSRREVGRDVAGNCYYVEEGGGQEKRSVQFAKGRFAFAEPEQLPVQWQSWLAHRRSEPPSRQELEEHARQQMALARRVADMEEEDKKLRMQQFQGTAPEPSGPTRSILQEAMGKMDG